MGAAREVFTTAVTHAGALLTHSAQNYGALVSKDLALCRLTLYSAGDSLAPAVEAYRAARAITKAEGIGMAAMRLFDALAIADVEGKLMVVRSAVGGE